MPLIQGSTLARCCACSQLRSCTSSLLGRLFGSYHHQPTWIRIFLPPCRRRKADRTPTALSQRFFQNAVTGNSTSQSNKVASGNATDAPNTGARINLIASTLISGAEGDSSIRLSLRHEPFEPGLPFFPIGQNLIQQGIKRRPVMRFGDVAKLVGDDVVDRVDRSLDETSVEEQT